MTQNAIGMVDDSESFSVLSRVASEALTYGAPAYEGPGPGEVAASGEVLLGVVVRDPMGEHQDPEGYQPAQTVRVLGFGVTMVQTPGGVTVDQPVHVGPEGWTAGPNGAALDRAAFAASRASAGLVRVRVAMPVEG